MPESSADGLLVSSAAASSPGLGRGLLGGGLVRAVAVLRGGLGHLERGGRVLQLLGVLALGGHLDPAGPALLAGLDGREGERLAGGVGHLEGQLEGVALALGQRVVGGVDDARGALGDLVAVGVGDRLVELLDVRLEVVVRVAGRRDREHRLRHLDLDLRGRRAVAAVRDAHREHGERPGGGLRRGAGDVGAGGRRHERDGGQGGQGSAGADERAREGVTGHAGSSSG